MLVKLVRNIVLTNLLRSYLNRSYIDFVKSYEKFRIHFNSKAFDLAVFANSLALLGRSGESRLQFEVAKKLSTQEGDYFLTLYCKASIADLDNDLGLYRDLSAEAARLGDWRSIDVLPLRI